MIYLTIALYLLGAVLTRNLIDTVPYRPGVRWIAGLLWPLFTIYAIVALIAEYGPGEVFWE